MIYYPPVGFGLTGQEPVQTRGDGFTHFARPDGATWVYVNHWSDAVARMLDDTRVSSILVSEHWSNSALDALQPHAAHVEELAISTAAIRDFSSLAAMPALRRLELHHTADGVPFGALHRLQECVIVGPAGLGSVHEAPALVHLTLDGLLLKDLRALDGMVGLRSLTVSSQKKMRLDGIEKLNVEHVKLRLRALESIGPLVNLRLHTIALHETRALKDVEAIGRIPTLEVVEIVGGASPSTLDFLTELRSLIRLRIEDTTIETEAASLTSIAHLAELRDLTLLGGRKSLRNLVHLEALGALHQLEKIHVHHGPKEVDTIRWVRDLRKLSVFRLQGTLIRDGDLTPLLQLPRLRDVTINPIANNYSHSPALFHLEMQQHVQSQDGAGKIT